MRWSCPACRRENDSEVPAAGPAPRFCTYCGAKTLVDPIRSHVPEPDAETGKSFATATIEAPARRAAQRGQGRPILVLMHGQKVGAELPLPAGAVRIGSEGADWEFPDLDLEPVHFEIRCEGERCSVTDLSGGAGITVNARPVPKADLHNGDQIHAGHANFLLLILYRDETRPSQVWDMPPIDVPSAKVFDEVDPFAGVPAEDSGGEAMVTVIVPKPRRDAVSSAAAAVELESGTESGRRIPLSFGSNIVGRGLCEIPLADPLASQRHAEIGRLPDGGFFVKDLASSNGTTLNGRRIEYSPLHDRDLLQVGDTLLRFRVE
jgi:pSer/pThr/pTyr-binding forkhead associated (FHA) protein